MLPTGDNFSTGAKQILDWSSEAWCIVQSELLRSKPVRRHARRVFALGHAFRAGEGFAITTVDTVFGLREQSKPRGGS
jgi:hypothetical protein